MNRAPLPFAAADPGHPDHPGWVAATGACPVPGHACPIHTRFGPADLMFAQRYPHGVLGPADRQVLGADPRTKVTISMCRQHRLPEFVCPDAPTCACAHPYLGAQMVGTPPRCEDCGGFLQGRR